MFTLYYVLSKSLHVANDVFMSRYLFRVIYFLIYILLQHARKPYEAKILWFSVFYLLYFISLAVSILINQVRQRI